MCNKQRDHKEGDEDSQWNDSLNLSNSKTFCQEDIFLLNLVEEQNDVPLKVLENNGVADVEILNEVADISLKNNHENSFQSSSKDRFDSMQEELLFGQPFHDKKVIEYFEICHVFYDPVPDYMDKFFKWSSWLYVCSKGQIFHHNLLLFCSYVLIRSSMRKKWNYWINCLIGFIGSHILLDWAFVLS